MNLKNRIEKLESIAPPPLPYIILRRIVSPENMTGQDKRIDTGNGIVTREIGESFGDFKERAARLAGWPGKTVRLIAPAPEDC